jgi:hypothetical protein
MRLANVKVLAAVVVAALYFALAPEVYAQRQEFETGRLFNTGVDPLADGHGRFRQEPGRRDVRVQVEDVFTTDLVWVFAIGPDFATIESIGPIFIDPARGFGGEIELNTQDGDPVPQLGEGWWIFVIDVYEPWPLLLFGELRQVR